VLPELAPQLSLDLLEVKWLHCCAWAAIYPWLIPNDLGAKGFWESTDRLTQVSLEEFDDRGWEIKLIGPLEDFSL
jgi:hypothetical protein